MSQLAPPISSIFPFGSVYTVPGSADAVLASLCSEEEERLFALSLLYYRGDWQGAANAARAMLQTSVSFEARIFISHMLSLEALYMGDDQKWLLSRQLLAQTQTTTERQRAQVEFYVAAMDSGIYVRSGFPSWFLEGRFDLLPVADYPFARYMYAKLLYIETAYDKLAAVVGTLISQSKAEHALLSELYLHIVAAMGFHSLGDEGRVETHIREALALALPDKLYAPLAENRRNLGTGLERQLKDADPEGLKTVLSLTDVILDGWTKLYNRLYGKKISNEMTPREYDVARLVFQGLTNKEIADRLGISVNTVKLYLRVIFEKLGISRRDDLTPFIWEEASPPTQKAP